MAIFLQKSENCYFISLKDEPPFIYSLPMAPSELEPILCRNLWLILVVAVWSGPDLAAMETASSVGKKLRGAVHVGLRPFDSHREITPWCPGVAEQHASPIWLILKDGRLLAERAGIRESAAIENWLRSYLPSN